VRTIKNNYKKQYELILHKIIIGEDSKIAMSNPWLTSQGEVIEIKRAEGMKNNNKTKVNLLLKNKTNKNNQLFPMLGEVMFIIVTKTRNSQNPTPLKLELNNQYNQAKEIKDKDSILNKHKNRSQTIIK